MKSVSHTIRFAGHEITCEHGANLRKVLLREGLSPYNRKARQINCRGLGTCGTCALKIEGEVSPMTRVETWRLGFPPHDAGSGLRLACQCQVMGDLELTKHPGFWGQDRPIPQEPVQDHLE
jgi:ferredoxin